MTAPEWLVAWAGDDSGSVLEVTAGGDAAAAVGAHVPALVADGVASGIARRDGSLWGASAVEEASKRLGWVDVEEASRPLVAQVEALRSELAAEGVDRVVLCGMGGSSLAPEVITRTAGVPLVVLDSTDPGQVRAALVDVARTVVVVSSKSGSTVETDSQRRAFEAAFTAAGIDAARRIVVVTDPGSPLEEASLAAGYRAVFRADPTVGGRFSALTAFGLVPSGLAGVDIGELLDEAAEVADLLADDAEGNPALVLGAALGGTTPLRDKVVFVDEGSGIVGFADWAEQLVAESTGKDGTGLLPVVVEAPQAPEVTAGAADVLVVRLVSGRDETDAVDPRGGCARRTGGERPDRGDGRRPARRAAPALGVRHSGRGPAARDQPVRPARRREREEGRPRPARRPAGTRARRPRRRRGRGARAPRGCSAARRTSTARWPPCSARCPRAGTSPSWPTSTASATRHSPACAAALAARTGRPVTFGWGPRFLHSTGQYHKGGPAVGRLPPGDERAGHRRRRPPGAGPSFTFGQLIAAQAAGDAQVLAEHGRPVLRLHLSNRAAGVRQVLATLGGSV